MNWPFFALWGSGASRSASFGNSGLEPRVALEAPKTPENSSRSKEGPTIGLGVPESGHQKQVKSTYIPMFWTYFQGPPQNLLSDLVLTYMNFSRVFGASRRTRAT